MNSWPDQHPGISPETGILLVNLGTPAAPTTPAVRRYLREFLSDRRVVDVSPWLWQPILNLAILPIRSPRSAKAYSEIWGQDGSPLLVQSQRLARRLGERLPKCHVQLAMRYGEPSIASAMDQFEQAGVERLIVLPLYPQYSRSTTASVLDAVAQALAQRYWMPALRFIRDYYRQPGWTRAIARQIAGFQSEHGQPDHLLFSLHGLPESFLQKGDPYFCQCHASVRTIAEHLGLHQSEFSLAFQSRVGRQQWLKPYTEDRLAQLAGQGCKHLQVVCPGFAVDCLETLEEVAIRGRETFLDAGGERLDYIPALNADDAHVDLLAGLIRQHLGDEDDSDVRNFRPELAESVVANYPDYDLAGD